jgi:uncharacterized RDD family membrane protein YckC
MTDTLSQAEQHFEQASSLEEQSDFQAALEECEAAIRLDPKFAEAHNLRGVILESLGREEEAISAYGEAVQLDPAFEEAQENLHDAENELLDGKHKALNTEGKKFGIRSAAYIIDSVVYTVASFVVQFLVIVMLGIAFALSGRELQFDEQSMQCLGMIVGLVRFTVYFTIFEWLYGATLGKLVLGMRVVKQNGEPCNFGAAFVRALVRYIDGLFFGIPAYATMKAPLYQRMGDKSAKTIVVGATGAIIQRPRDWWWFLVAAGLYLALDTIVALFLLIAVIR